jgi:hypothetical protein
MFKNIIFFMTIKYCPRPLYDFQNGFCSEIKTKIFLSALAKKDLALVTYCTCYTVKNIWLKIKFLAAHSFQRIFILGITFTRPKFGQKY